MAAVQLRFGCSLTEALLANNYGWGISILGISGSGSGSGSNSGRQTMDSAAIVGDRSAGDWSDSVQEFRDGNHDSAAGPSEPQIHIEHQAALDATVFQKASDPYELVLELDSGELRIRGDHE